MMIAVFGPTSNRDQAIRAKIGGAKQFGKTILQKRLYQWTNGNHATRHRQYSPRLCLIS